MRGKVTFPSADRSPSRITPAHAGKRQETGSAERKARDHPRACGEKCGQLAKTRDRRGSPPRMRGKVTFPFADRSASRITPAHAGKRSSLFHPASPFRDHPRACGEKVLARVAHCFAWGSPPRMRGKDTGSSPYIETDGITPAHAGKRIDLYMQAAGWEDHPRACGEKSPASWASISF